MTKNKNNPLDRAGTMLLHAAKLQARALRHGMTPQIDVVSYRAQLAKVRELLEEEKDASAYPHKFATVKTALESLEAVERGNNPLNTVGIFKGHVEAILGGERAFDFGGKRVTNRPSSDISYLKAAAYVLWKRNFDRNQLALDAQSLLGFASRKKLRTFVNNSTDQKPDGLGMPQSTIWAHIPLIEDLVENYEYKALTDFA